MNSSTSAPPQASKKSRGVDLHSLSQTERDRFYAILGVNPIEDADAAGRPAVTGLAMRGMHHRVTRAVEMVASAIDLIETPNEFLDTIGWTPFDTVPPERAIAHLHRAEDDLLDLQRSVTYAITGHENDFAQAAANAMLRADPEDESAQRVEVNDDDGDVVEDAPTAGQLEPADAGTPTFNEGHAGNPHPVIDPDAAEYEAACDRIDGAEAAALAELRDATNRPKLDSFYYRWLYRDAGFVASALIGPHFVDKEGEDYLLEHLGIAVSRVNKAYADALAAQPPITPGQRVFDKQSNDGGVVLLVSDRDVVYLRDTSEEGYGGLSWTNLSDTIVMENIPAIPRDEVVGLIARFLPGIGDANPVAGSILNAAAAHREAVPA